MPFGGWLMLAQKTTCWMRSTSPTGRGNCGGCPANWKATGAYAVFYTAKGIIIQCSETALHAMRTSVKILWLPVVWKSHSIPISTKIRAMKALVWPACVATYGCESWTLRERMKKHVLTPLRWKDWERFCGFRGQQRKQMSDFFVHSRGSKYCDQHVCMSVSVRSHISNYTSTFYQIYRTCYQWRWLCSLVTAKWQVIHTSGSVDDVMFPYTGMNQIKDDISSDNVVWSRSPCGGTGGEVCRLRLHLFI